MVCTLLAVAWWFGCLLACDPKILGRFQDEAVYCCFLEQENVLTLLQPTQLYMTLGGGKVKLDSHANLFPENAAIQCKSNNLYFYSSLFK